MKIFIGNLDDRTTVGELERLFEKYGSVVSCAVKKQFAFVHMRGTERAMKAIEELNGHELNGKRMVVELSKPRPQNTWKIFVGNISLDCDVTEIRRMFEVYGRVLECAVVKDYAFVHMEREADARQAIERLDGKEIKGKRINVEMSKKALRSVDCPDSSRSRRSNERRDVPQSRSEAYNRRRAPEMDYPSYSVMSPFERSVGDSLRYDEYEKMRQPSSLYYSRERSPLRSAASRASYVASLAAKYNSPSEYDMLSSSSSYGGQPSSSSYSPFSSQTSDYSSRAAAFALANYGKESTSYGSQSSAFYGSQGSSMPATYSSQVSPMASSYNVQTSASPYASNATGSAYAPSSTRSNTYYQQPSAACDSSQTSSFGSQSTYSAFPAATDAPMYERTRLSPPQSSVSDGYKNSAESFKSRFAPDRHYAELSDYRCMPQDSANTFRQSPSNSQMDFRHTPETHSDYSSYNDYVRAAQASGYPRQL